MTTALVWFRNDLRTELNPAFLRATETHDDVIAAVVLDQHMLATAGPYRRSMWLASVAALHDDLSDSGGGLTVVAGPPFEAIPKLVAQTGADTIYVNHSVSAFARTRDDAVEAAAGVPMVRSWGTLVTEPGAVLTQKGTLSRVFTPFSKKWLTTPLPDLPAGGSGRVGFIETGVALPEYDPPPIPAGTAAAYRALADWLALVDDYEHTRDLPAIAGTSMLSAHLRMGSISPRAVLDQVGGATEGRAAFTRQLAWRDWYAHLLVEMPHMASRAVRPEYDAIAWLDDPEGLEAWKVGRTGYPIVDAGMRQLAETGWMHNRVRMIVGSFLVKDLLIDWREGERWFRRMLIDGEPSQNAGNWQWVAGTGTDAAPYFRIFNPISQSKKFDATGTYIRRWVPELAGLDDKVIHAPWESGPLDLAAAGVILGDTYPAPIIDHAFARDRTLTAYKRALGKE